MLFLEAIHYLAETVTLFLLAGADPESVLESAVEAWSINLGVAVAVQMLLVCFFHSVPQSRRYTKLMSGLCY